MSEYLPHVMRHQAGHLDEDIWADRGRDDGLSHVDAAAGVAEHDAQRGKLARRSDVERRKRERRSGTSVNHQRQVLFEGGFEIEIVARR